MLKKVLRMIVFSGLALYFTSIWNKGFIIPHDIVILLKLSIFLAVLHYLVIPIAKIVLFPLRFLTLGFITIFVQLLLFYFFLNYGHFITIKEWSLGTMHFSYIFNLVLSSISLSVIITLLETVL